MITTYNFFFQQKERQILELTQATRQTESEGTKHKYKVIDL